MRRLLALASACALTGPAWGWSDWRTLKTESFTVFHRPGQEEQARALLRTLEFHRPGVERLTGNRMRSIPFVIQDAGAISNGETDPVNRTIHVYAYPPSAAAEPELAYTENWWSDVGVHEYTHMLHLSKAGGLPAVIQALVGNVTPNAAAAPAWMAEGIAVYQESAIRPHQGRLNDGFYDAYLGAVVRERGAPPGILTATYAPLEYPRGGWYLYGGEFVGWLGRTRGPAQLTAYYGRLGSMLGGYLSPLFPWIGIDRAARKAFGRSMSALWDEWRASETIRFKDFAPEGERVTRHGWTVRDLAIANGKLYYVRA
ncbi:MAG: hypothetical protein AAB368_13090, partial [bacterium]